MICLECELMSQPNLFIFNIYIYEQHSSGSSGRRVGNYESMHTLYKSDYLFI